MSKQFEEIKMYKCKWCGKTFRTTRHDCKFDADKVNCFTCKYSNGINISGWESGETPYFECDKYDYILDACGKEEYSEVEYLKENHYHTDCPCYEQIDNYVGKESLSGEL